MASKHEELELLYSSVCKVVTEGLQSFEKSASLNLPQLQCTLMVLKAACNNDPCYIDRCGWLVHAVGELDDASYKMHIQALMFISS